jgi:hypothetical protein
MKYLVLFTHQSWPMHYFQAGVIARGLMNEGHEIYWLNCAKTMPGCHVHWILPQVPPEDICKTCTERTSWLDYMGIRHESMGAYLSPHDHEDATRTASLEDLVALSTMMDGETPIGSLALSSPASASRSLSILDPDPALKKSLPKAVASALLVNRAILKFLETHRIDGIIVHLGRLIPDQIAQFHANKMDIPWYCFETGPVPNTLRLVKNGTIYSYSFYLEDWNRYKHRPLSSDASSKTKDYLLLRRLDSKKSGLYTYSPPETSSRELLKELGLADDARLITFFTSSEDENAALGNSPDPTWVPVYPSQLKAIAESIDWAVSHPDWTLVVRVHPNEAARANHLGMAGRKSMEALSRFLDDKGVPSNVRIVWPEEAISSITLMMISQVGIVWASTVGMEMAVMGGRVIVTDNPVYRTAGFTWNVETTGSLEATIQQALDSKPEDLELRTSLALRWVYHQEFRRSIPFPMIHDHGRMERISLKFTTPQSLTGRNCPSLASIVDFITLGYSPYRDGDSTPEDKRDYESFALQLLKRPKSSDPVQSFVGIRENESESQLMYQRIAQGVFGSSGQKVNLAIEAALNSTPAEAPWRSDLVCRLLLNLKSLDRHEQAAELITKESQLCSNSSDFYFAVGEIFFDWACKRPDEAEQMLPVAEVAWRRCLEVGLRPNLPGVVSNYASADAAHNLALVLEGTGRKAEAFEVRKAHNLPMEPLLS